MEPGRERRSDGILAGAVAAAVLALLAPALRRGEGLLPVASLWRVPPWSAVLPHGPGNGLLSDQFLYFWPWRIFLRRELLSGHFPLWNPYQACGVPFAACIQAAAFFPTELGLASWLAPVSWSLLSAFLKLFTAGFFAALYARRLGARVPGAALSGVSFALCGFMVAWLGHPQANAACLLPALFWCLARAFDSDRPGAWAGVGLVVGLVLLGGHPPTAVHVLSAGAAYAFFLTARARRDERPRLLVGGGLAVLAGAGLAAPAWLPYIEYLRLSSTAASSAALARWSFHLSPWALAHLLMPLASGSPAHGAEVLAAAFGFGPVDNFVERAGWVGLPALALAVRAVVARRADPETRFLAGLALFGLAAALGLPPLPWLWRLLPGFSAINPMRLILLFCFGASVLAGLGVEVEANPRLARAIAAFLAMAGAACFWRYAGVWGGLIDAERGFALGQLFAFFAEAALAVWLIANSRFVRWAALPAALFLLRVGWGVNPSAPAEWLYPRTPGIERLAAEAGEGRVFGLGWAFAPNLNLPFGLRDARGRDFTSLRRYEELVTGQTGDFDFYSAAAQLPPSPRLFGISALAATAKTASAVPADWERIHDGDMLVFRAPRPGSRIFFVPEARAASKQEVLAAVRVPDFDPTKVVWFDDGPVPAVSHRATGGAQLASEGSDEVLVAVQSDGPGWLLLLDSWYPGWKAEVNGEPAPLRRADYAFRAVPVPGGACMVRFHYVPLPFWAGLALAVLSAAALAAAVRF